jgi:hypothetical protein
MSHVIDQSPASASHVGDVQPTTTSHVGGIDVVEKIDGLEVNLSFLVIFTTEITLLIYALAF